MTAHEKAELDQLVANFIFAAKLPLSIVESNSFKKFVKFLNPSYIPPSVKDLITM